jgi:hypothetical protein
VNIANPIENWLDDYGRKPQRRFVKEQ